MEKSKQEYLRKIKLKLEQPAIVCSGRKRVECYYRGQVVRESQDTMWIIFKTHGVQQSVIYDKMNKEFYEWGQDTPDKWKDLKIIE